MGCKEYLLRGIATSENVIYVCQRAPADLIELDDNPLPRDQWWRLSLNAKAVEPVKAEVRSYQVRADILMLLTNLKATVLRRSPRTGVD